MQSSYPWRTIMLRRLKRCRADSNGDGAYEPVQSRFGIGAVLATCLSVKILPTDWRDEMKLVTAIVCVALLSAVGLAQQQAVTEQVWSGEEAYWRYVQSHDLKHYLSLWSDDFVGWPILTDHPIHKTDIASQFQSGRLSQVITYELHRESVEMHGPIGVAFYRVEMRLRKPDQSEFTTTSRLTHTWMKKGDVWQIVAGMSADDSRPTAAK